MKVVHFKGVYTSKKLNKTQLQNSEKYEYFSYIPNHKDVSVGDRIMIKGRSIPFQVIDFQNLSEFPTRKDIPFMVIESINGISLNPNEVTFAEDDSNKVYAEDILKDIEFPLETINKTTKMTNNKMMSGMLDKFKAQFFPEVEENARISMDGAICVPVNGEYVGIKSDGSLMTYPEELLVKCPIYSIAKSQSQVVVGDVIKNGRNYGKVLGRNHDGSLKVLYFSGVESNKQEIKDALLGQSMVRVLVNMFNVNGNNGINPLMFLALSDDNKFDMKTLLLMQMMQGNNTQNGFNPMMLMLLSDKEEGKNDILTTMLMMQMMGGNMNFFGTPSVQSISPSEATPLKPEVIA